MHDQRCAQRTADATGAYREQQPVDAIVAHRRLRSDGAPIAYRGAATSGRDGCVTRAQRTDTATTTTTDTTEGRSPGRERTDRTGQRAPRTDERQRGQPTERVDRGGKSERPPLKAFGSVWVGPSYRTCSVTPDPDSKPWAVALTLSPRCSSASVSINRLKRTRRKGHGASTSIDCTTSCPARRFGVTAPVRGSGPPGTRPDNRH